jgi:hypothetical protein
MNVFVYWWRTTEGYEARDSFRRITASSVFRDDAINFVKGACLHVIADFNIVPSVTFHTIAVLTPKPKRPSE